MKISIGSKIIEGPRGRKSFVKNLSEYLIKNNHEVIYDLSEPDIDLILLTDPRSRKESSSSFNHIKINRYKDYVNNGVKVVQRINECDERKGTENINAFYLEASNSADQVVFVSSWMESIYLNLGMDKNKTSVILSGSNREIFNETNSSYLNKSEKLNYLRTTGVLIETKVLMYKSILIVYFLQINGKIDWNLHMLVMFYQNTN